MRRSRKMCVNMRTWHEIYIHHITDMIRLSLAGGEINDHLWFWMLWLDFNMPLQLDTLILHFTKRVFLLYNEIVVICEFFINLHWNYINLNWYLCSLKRFSKTLDIFLAIEWLISYFSFFLSRNQIFIEGGKKILN